MRLKISPLLIALPALLALVACNKSSDSIGGIPRTEEPISEYVSLSPSTSELLAAVGLPVNRIYGRTESCNYPATIASVPVVVRGTTPDFEMIAKVQAQRVILEKDLYSEATVEKLKEISNDVYIVDTSTPDKYRDTLIKLSKDAGSEQVANSYLDKVYGGASVFKGAMPQGAKICVIIGDSTSGYMVLGKNTLLGNYIKEAGAELMGPDSGRFESVGAEKLLQYNPNIIITPKGVGTKVFNDAQLKSVDAIAKGHVLDVEPDILLREGGRVDVLLESLGTGIGRIELIKGN